MYPCMLVQSRFTRTTKPVQSTQAQRLPARPHRYRDVITFVTDKVSAHKELKSEVKALASQRSRFALLLPGTKD